MSKLVPKTLKLEYNHIYIKSMSTGNHMNENEEMKLFTTIWFEYQDAKFCIFCDLDMTASYHLLINNWQSIILYIRYHLLRIHFLMNHIAF